MREQLKSIVIRGQTQEQKIAKRMLMKELETLAAPLVEWLRVNHGYHTEIHISSDYVSVKHDGFGIPYPISEK